MRNWISKLRRVFLVRFAMEVMGRFGRDNVALISAGLAFFTTLTFVPLLLTAISALGFWLEVTHRTSMDATTIVQRFLMQNVLPGAAGKEVQHLIERANVTATVHHIMQTRSAAGLVGLLGVIWAAMQIFVNGSTAMNAAWELKENRGWVKLRLVSLGLLVATGLLSALSLVATGFGSWISRHLVFPGAALLITVGTEAGAVVVSTLMYALIYRFLPAGRVTWRAAAVGALFSAVAWEVAKKGFAVYLLRPNHSLYGGLADLIIFVLWIYYSMMILLLGAEVGSTYTAEVENARRTALRRTAGVTPAADTTNGASPLARRKQKTRNQRISKASVDKGIEARRG